MMESKKTTTISFRIEDDLKEKLLSIAEQENKTITNKARESLTLRYDKFIYLVDPIEENIRIAGENMSRSYIRF